MTRCRCCQGRPPVLLRVLVGSVAAVAVAQAKTAEWPRANTASRRWHWRSGDRPSCLSGPRRKEPRSAAERLLALETKFLLFWAGQEQDSVLSRSPAPRSDCSSALRERNLPVATLWPSPTSGTLGGRRFRAEKGGGDQGWRRDGLLESMERQTKLARAWSVGSMERSNQAGGGLVRWTDGRVKASWRTAWSVGSLERGQTARSLGFGWWRGALTRSRCREFKGRPRDNKTIRSVWPKLPFSRSVRVSTGARGVHQATAPSTQLVGCDGDWPAYRSSRALAG